MAQPALKVQTVKCWPVRAQLHAVIHLEDKPTVGKSQKGHKAKGTFYVLTNSFLAFFLFGLCIFLEQLLVELSKVN